MDVFLFLIHVNESVILNWTLSFCFLPQRRSKKEEHVVFDRSEFGDFLGRTIFSVRWISWAVLSASATHLPEIVLIPGASTGSGSLFRASSNGREISRFCVGISVFSPSFFRLRPILAKL